MSRETAHGVSAGWRWWIGFCNSVPSPPSRRWMDGLSALLLLGAFLIFRLPFYLHGGVPQIRFDTYKYLESAYTILHGGLPEFFNHSPL